MHKNQWISWCCCFRAAWRLLCMKPPVADVLGLHFWLVKFDTVALRFCLLTNCRICNIDFHACDLSVCTQLFLQEDEMLARIETLENQVEFYTLVSWLFQSVAEHYSHGHIVVETSSFWELIQTEKIRKNTTHERQGTIGLASAMSQLGQNAWQRIATVNLVLNKLGVVSSLCRTTSRSYPVRIDKTIFTGISSLFLHVQTPCCILRSWVMSFVTLYR